MGLRLRRRHRRREFAARTGRTLARRVDPLGLARLAELGFVDADAARPAPDRRGRPLLNAVLAELV